MRKLGRKWRWFHRMGSPRWFYEITGRWLPWLIPLAFSLLAIGLFWGLFLAPPDARQGQSYRIIFVHVPASFLALVGYYVLAIAGAIGLIWRIKMSFILMKAAAPIGAALTFIALFTGAIWGKPTWGTYWVWDARITSMLILLFLYLGVMALQRALVSTDTAFKASAILALIGTVNIPIIYKSVDWWYTLHQPATLKLTSSSTMHIEMLQPLFLMICGFYLFYVLVLILFARLEILQREKSSRWVRSLVSEDYVI